MEKEAQVLHAPLNLCGWVEGAQEMWRESECVHDMKVFEGSTLEESQHLHFWAGQITYTTIGL